mmetsp:Transcript_18930/g.36125  ORF Transcript_18930/g.36125 Transcript_18930/m.36125 type:complete len:240 (-) Transcript_18930:1459-2178(-)
MSWWSFVEYAVTAQIYCGYCLALRNSRSTVFFSFSHCRSFKTHSMPSITFILISMKTTSYKFSCIISRPCLPFTAVCTDLHSSVRKILTMSMRMSGSSSTSRHECHASDTHALVTVEVRSGSGRTSASITFVSASLSVSTGAPSNTNAPRRPCLNLFRTRFQRRLSVLAAFVGWKRVDRCSANVTAEALLKSQLKGRVCVEDTRHLRGGLVNPDADASSCIGVASTCDVSAGVASAGAH